MSLITLPIKSFNCPSQYSNHFVGVSPLPGAFADLCQLNNGGCSQVCYNLCNLKVKCGCWPGYTLAYDGKTCTGKKSYRSFLFLLFLFSSFFFPVDLVLMSCVFGCHGSYLHKYHRKQNS